MCNIKLIERHKTYQEGSHCLKIYFANLICRLNVFLIKIAISFSLEVGKWILKYMFKHRKLWRAKIPFRKLVGGGKGRHLPNQMSRLITNL